MFLNNSTHTVDKNGRTFLPKRFQKRIPRDDQGGQSVVLTPGFDGCLFIFTMEQYAKEVEDQHKSVFADPGVRSRQRKFFGMAHEAPLDSSGRIMIPEKFRKGANITKEVTVVGAGTRIELWNPELWAKIEAEAELDDDGLGFGFGGEVVS